MAFTSGWGEIRPFSIKMTPASVVIETLLLTLSFDSGWDTIGLLASFKLTTTPDPSSVCVGFVNVCTTCAGLIQLNEVSVNLPFLDSCSLPWFAVEWITSPMPCCVVVSVGEIAGPDNGSDVSVAFVWSSLLSDDKAGGSFDVNDVDDWLRVKASIPIWSKIKEKCPLSRW